MHRDANLEIRDKMNEMLQIYTRTKDVSQALVRSPK